MVATNQAIRAAREYNENSPDHRKAIVRVDETFGAEIEITASGKSYTSRISEMALDLNACLHTYNEGITLY